jgi:hypothetical protein
MVQELKCGLMELNTTAVGVIIKLMEKESFGMQMETCMKENG